MEKIYSVSEITRNVRLILEGALPPLWVDGEVSNYSASTAGHVYFSLKDAGGMLKCVIFKSNNSRLGFKLNDGMHVLCFGKISVYEKSGQYQLYVEKAEPKGKGALYAAFEKLKVRLGAEGLFDEARKRPLPFLPMRVGVITSPTGAAIHDILKVARRRFANIEITIVPVKVQGDGAKEEIARAIKDINEYNELVREMGGERPIDVLIVGRGGGSFEDLWPFNEEVVARAIFSSVIPVVSAVGHEVDFTIADFTADARAATPSAAAEMVIPEKEELKKRIVFLDERITAAARAEIEACGEKLKRLRRSYVLREPVNFLLQLEQAVDNLTEDAGTFFSHYVELKNNAVSSVFSKLGALSPLGVLERGYSITFKDGKVIGSVADLSVGDVLMTRFAHGEAKSRVESRKI